MFQLILQLQILMTLQLELQLAGAQRVAAVSRGAATPGDLPGHRALRLAARGLPGALRPLAHPGAVPGGHAARPAATVAARAAAVELGSQPVQ